MMLAPGHDWKAVDQWEEDALLMEKYAFIGKTEAFHELFILAPRLDTDPGELIQAILLSLSKERPKAFKKALSKEDKRIQKSVKVLLDFTEAP